MKKGQQRSLLAQTSGTKKRVLVGNLNAILTGLPICVGNDIDVLLVLLERSKIGHLQVLILGNPLVVRRSAS